MYGLKSSITAALLLTSIMPGLVLAEQVGTTKTLAYSCAINVITGKSDCKDAVEILESRYGQLKAKASLCSVVDGNKVTEVEFLAHVGAKPIGWLLNLGDSATNNGYGGDWGSNGASQPWKEGQKTTGQSNDAEIHLNANLSNVGSWSVWGNESTQNAIDGYRRLFAENNVNFANKTVRVLIKDQGAELQVMDGVSTPKQLSSPYLFALNGQPDFQGPGNCDIYLGINRVIDGLYRSGSGIDNVEINLYSQPATSASVSLNGDLLEQLGMVSTKASPVLPSGIITSLSPDSYAKIAQQLKKIGVHPESVNIAMLGGSQKSRQMAMEAMRAQGLVTTDKPTMSSIRKALRRFRRVALPRSPEMAAQLLAAEKVGEVK